MNDIDQRLTLEVYKDCKNDIDQRLTLEVCKKIVRVLSIND
jgi:hypothetical protein